MVVLVVLILGFLIVLIPITISGNRLGRYVKMEYPDIYSKHIKPIDANVYYFGPSLYFFSKDAKKLSQSDSFFKTLRRRYVTAWLLLPTWLILWAVFMITFGRYFE